MYDPGLDDLSKSDIDLVIDWAAAELELEEPDSLWRQGVAAVFARYRIWDAAIENFQIALELDNTAWAVYLRLAQIYRSQGRSDLAMEKLAYPIQEFRNHETLIAENQRVYYSMHRLLGDCYEKQSQYDKAISLYQEVLKHNQEAWDLALSLIMSLNAQEKYSEIMEFIRALNGYWDPKFGGSRLTKMLHGLARHEECLKIFFHTAKVTNNLPLVMKAYKTAMDKAKENADQDLAYVVHSLSHQYGIALLYYGGEGSSEDAARLWEQNLSDAMAGGAHVYFLYANLKRLCWVYLHNAKIAGWASAVAKSNIEKLARLSINNMGADLLDFVDIDPTLALGRYFQLTHQRDEAMASVRPHIKIALDLLSDDDPTNDWQGYYKLARVLTHLNNDVNAQAAWSLIRPYDPPKCLRDGTVKRYGPLHCFCEGKCDYMFEFAAAMYVCRDCLEVQFDRKCWELLTTQKATFTVCDHRHEFLYIPEWNADEQQKVGSGMVKVGDTVVPIKEWLAAIRATWSLTGTGMVYGVVRYDFNAEHPDELEAKSGEKVTIIAQSNRKWFVAKPIGRPGEQGLIPVSYVQVKDVATGQTVADPQEAVKRAGVASVDVLKLYGLL